MWHPFNNGVSSPTPFKWRSRRYGSLVKYAGTGTMTAAPWRSLSELEEELVSAEAATATLQATADEAHAKAFAAQLAANVAGRRARDIRFRIIRRRHEMGSGLTGMAAVSRAFLFLDGPANVLRAATTCSRWRELATADSVWRAKAVREGIVEKAGVFEVPLPAAAATAATGGGGGGGASSCDGAASKDKLAGVGLAFYAQIYVLQVGPARSLVSVRRRHHCAPYHSSC